MEKIYNLLEAYTDMILLHLNSKEPHFNGCVKELHGKTCIFITNYKHDFKYIIELDDLSVPPALMLALQIYNQFLKDMGVKL